MISKNENNNQNSSQITKKDLTRMAVNTGALGMEYSWNYPKQMSMAFCIMIEPYLRKIYRNNPEGYKKALSRHMQFFNITPHFAPFVGGVVLSMEEKLAKGEIEGTAIDSVKAALMGPLSGIGDSIFYGCLRIIALGVGLSLATQGSILGPILYFLIYNIPAFACKIIGARKGYDLGVGFLTKAQESGLMDKLMFGAGILGTMVIGAMSKDMIYVTAPLAFGSGDNATTLQKLLDGILPGALGLSATWIYYYLLNKKVNPIILIIGTIIIGIVGVYFGVLA